MVDDAEALSLMRECRELEERYKSNFISQILSVEEPADGLEIIREAQKHIIKINEDQALPVAGQSFKLVTISSYLRQIAKSVGCGIMYLITAPRLLKA